MLSLPTTELGLHYLVAPDDRSISTSGLVPFSNLACDFLNELSQYLLSEPNLHQYPDVFTFAFWCRKSNISKLKIQYSDSITRLGLGLVFHIAPANVPINFAYSYVFALLSGNASIVRVSTKEFPQVDIICQAINIILSKQEFKVIQQMTVFVKYQHNEKITSLFSKNCQGRIIWGGDETIKTIRQFPVPARSVDICFADRYSFCAINADSFSNVDEIVLKKLARNFFNDVFLMDQNACSSPHLIIWLGQKLNVPSAKQRFWNYVADYARTKYKFEAIQAIDKYISLCSTAINYSILKSLTKHENYIYRIELEDLDSNVDVLRGFNGTFFEFTTNNLNNIASIVNSKYQTLTYFGIEKKECLDFVLYNQLPGIDRIVPIGQALDIGLFWDGYDIVRNLSRVIDYK